MIGLPLGKAFLVEVVVVAFAIFVAPSRQARLPLLPVCAVLPLPAVRAESRKGCSSDSPVTDALLALAHQAVLPVHRLRQGDSQLPGGVPAGEREKLDPGLGLYLAECPNRAKQSNCDSLVCLPVEEPAVDLAIGCIQRPVLDQQVNLNRDEGQVGFVIGCDQTDR